MFNSSRSKDGMLFYKKGLNNVTSNPYTDKATAIGTSDPNSHRIGVNSLDINDHIKSREFKGRSALSHAKSYKIIARKLKIDDVKKL